MIRSFLILYPQLAKWRTNPLYATEAQEFCSILNEEGRLMFEQFVTLLEPLEKYTILLQSSALVTISVVPQMVNVNLIDFVLRICCSCNSYL